MDNRYYLHISEYVWIRSLNEFLINSNELIDPNKMRTFVCDGKQFYLHSLKGFRRFRLVKQNDIALHYESEDKIICRILK